MQLTAVRVWAVWGALVLAACGDGGGGATPGQDAATPVAGAGSNGVAGTVAPTAGTQGTAGTASMIDAGHVDAEVGDAEVDAAADTDAALPPCVCDGSVAPALACKEECASAFEALYSERQFPSFYLTIFDDNGGPGLSSSWDNIFTECTKDEASSKMPPVECDHQLATFHAEYDPTPDDGVDDTVTTPELEVGVARKGRFSWDEDSDAKPSLKVKFTEFGGERFLGLTRLTLNNAMQDPSMLRERVSYYVYRESGVVAPEATNAKLYIRKSATEDYEYYGVYVNVQAMDRRFVEYHYGEVGGEVGNLYDTFNDEYFTELDRADCRQQAGTAPGAQEARYELETNEALNDRSDLTALIDSVFKPGCSTSAICGGSNCCCNPTNWDQSNFFENVSTYADTQAWLRMFAVQAINTDWDGYAGTRNNFKLYRDLNTGKFQMFPWGTDQSQGYQDNNYYPNWNYALNHTNANRTRSLFMIRCEDDPDDCYAKYLAEVESMRALYETLPLLTLIDAWEAQIEDAVLADTHKNEYYDDARFRRNVDALRQYVEKRAACVGRQLANMSCETLGCPAGMSDCDTSGN